VPAHELEPLDDLAADRRRRGPLGSGRLGRPDQEQGRGRECERHCVDQDRERRADDLDERPRQAGPADLGERRARGQLAVAVNDPIDPDERGNVGGVGGVEQGAKACLHEHDEVELLHPQDPGDVGDRDREQEQRPHGVGPDQEGAAPKPIRPGPGEQPHEENREAARYHEPGHPPGARAEDQQRGQRHGGARHDRAELGHGLTRPQLEEVGVSPERRGCHGRRRLAAPLAPCRRSGGPRRRGYGCLMTRPIPGRHAARWPASGRERTGGRGAGTSTLAGAVYAPPT
jgi:hypothetical protein